MPAAPQIESCKKHPLDDKCRTRSEGGPVDAVVAGLAGVQHGVVSRRLLLELGVGRGGINARVARGGLHPLFHGVYAVGHRVVSRDGWRLAAVLACGAGAVLSHRAAAAVHGLVAAGSGALDVTRPRSFRAQRGIRAHQAALRPDEVTRVDAIAVTSPFRTVLDLAGEMTRREVERVVGEMEARKVTDVVPFGELFRRHPGKRGAAALRAVLEGDAPRGVTRSEMEEAFVAFLAEQRLPWPELNADLAVGERFVEIDALWRTQRLAVELDSRGFHDTARAFESDRERDRALVAQGWRPLRITWRQLHRGRSGLANDLRLALGRAGARTL